MIEVLDKTNLQGIVDNHLPDASKEQYDQYLKLISLMTKLGHITWNESYTSTTELYSTTIDQMDLEVHLGYDAETDVLYMYVDDLQNKVCAFYDGDDYEQDLTNIYTSMVTTSEYDSWDKDTELEDNGEFILGVNYDSQILGEVVKVFHLNINYNMESLG